MSYTTTTPAVVHAQIGTKYHYADQAPCGARVLSHDPDKVRPSSEDLSRVTCATCQTFITHIAKAFNRARRLRTITWGAK